MIEAKWMINHQIKFYFENAKQVFSIKFFSVLIISIPSAIVAEYYQRCLGEDLGDATAGITLKSA